jgi:ABC-type transporter Mla maintaining outer membrane lipid asymmetry ATPase subunit MlaF
MKSVLIQQEPETSRAHVTATDVARRYGDGNDVCVMALRGVSLGVAEGKRTAVMGPSGSGDSTPGQGGEAEITETFYEAAREPKETWLVPGAEHTGGIEAQPEEYERRVVGFFDDALLEKR